MVSNSFYVPDARLNRAMHQFPERYASVDEYAIASGLDVSEVMGLLEPFFEDGSLYLELVNGETFVLTAPEGRPIKKTGACDVPANLWERLRAFATPGESYLSWKLMRSLERNGWSVRASNLEECRIGTYLAPLQSGVGGRLIPVVLYDKHSSIGSAIGVLAEAARRGIRAVILCCENGELDRLSTEVRRYLLDGRGGRIYVLVLEAPTYNPVLFSANDNAVLPKSVSRVALDKELDL
jgi:hypothetical protein